MVQKNKKLSVRRQCELLQINRTGLYSEKKGKSEEKADQEERLMSRIDCLHTEMPYIGSRKIAACLRSEGYAVVRKLVRRLMLEMGLCVIYPKPNLSKADRNLTILPYLLRNMDINRPNQVWSIDITYIKMRRRHMYLTAIIDWHTRKLMGWKLSDTLDTENVIATVKETVAKHGAPSIINSDQGAQFTSVEYKKLLKDYGIRQSMDGKSRWADNVIIERWFRNLKTEMIYINEFSTPRELLRAISGYVDQYNLVRPHAALNNVPPEVYYNRYFAIAS